MLLSNLIGGMIVLVTGLIVRIFKTANLIAGYNTLPKREKERFDKDKLCRYVGNMMILAAGILFLGAALSLIPGLDFIVITASWVFFIVYLLTGVIYMNSGNKFIK